MNVKKPTCLAVLGLVLLVSGCQFAPRLAESDSFAVLTLQFDS